MTTWVDTTTCIPWKQEFRDRRDVVYRTYTTDSLKVIASAKGKKYLTITERTMWARGKTSYTKLYFESVGYDVGLTDADFSDAHLLVPLDSWYRGTMPCARPPVALAALGRYNPRLSRGFAESRPSSVDPGD